MISLSRTWLLALSVVDCGAGALGLWGPHGARSSMLVVNFALAVLLAITTGIDLHARGFRLGWLVGLSYLAAPLVGFVLYAILSSRPLTPLPVTSGT